jgi:hypothetical protein
MSLALVRARRLRDLLVFVPGLFAWQLALAHKQESSGDDGSGSGVGQQYADD